jgi:hypothetical protein
MVARRITERFEFSGKVGEGDKANVIEDVLLCGPKSRNRRRYLKKAFEGERVKRYNGRPVYINHTDGRSKRIYQDLIGVVENAHHNDAGLPVGNVRVNPEKPYGRALLWDAKNNPTACGMSHVADCETVKAADGWDDVTEVVHVESVDFVVDPATTNGFREQRETVMAVTIKELAAWVQRNPKAKTDQILGIKRLAEMDGMGDVGVMDAPPDDGAEADEPGLAAFKAAIMETISTCMGAGGDPTECLKKVKELLKGHAAYKGEKPKDTPADAPADDAAAKESVQREATAITEAMAECDKAKFRPSGRQLKIVARTPIAERADTIAELKRTTEGAGRETPIAGARLPGGGAGTGGGDAAAAAAEEKRLSEALGDGKKFKDFMLQE